MRNFRKQHAFTLIELVTAISLMVCCLYFFSQKFINTSGQIVKISVKLCESIINSAKWNAINNQEDVYFFVDVSRNNKTFCKQIGFFIKDSKSNKFTLKHELILPDNAIIVHSDYFSQIGISSSEFTRLRLGDSIVEINDDSRVINYVKIDKNGTFVDSYGNKKNFLLILASGKYTCCNESIALEKINYSDGIRPLIILNNGKILYTELSNVTALSVEI